MIYLQVNRNKQTKIQRQRTSGVVRTKRVHDGSWDLIRANKFGIDKYNYPLLSLERWCMRHTELLRKINMRRKR